MERPRLRALQTLALAPDPCCCSFCTILPTSRCDGGSGSCRSVEVFVRSNDKRLQARSNMPGAIVEYRRATSQRAPETTGAFARCALESLRLKYRSVLKSLEFFTGSSLHTLRVVGGGSLNSLLCQMFAEGRAM
jgi:hypothetical protein